MTKKSSDKDLIKSDPVSKRGGKREGAGRKAYEPTEQERKMVQIMEVAEIPHADMIDVLTMGRRPERITMSKRTFYKHFKLDLKQARAVMTSQVVQRLHEQALSGNMRAIIFYLQSRAGWNPLASKIEDDEMDDEIEVTFNMNASGGIVNVTPNKKEG